MQWWLHNCQQVEHTVLIFTLNQQYAIFSEKSVWLNVFDLSKRHLDADGGVLKVVHTVFLLCDYANDPFSGAGSQNRVNVLHNLKILIRF